jgi:hypothetical protein
MIEEEKKKDQTISIEYLKSPTKENCNDISKKVSYSPIKFFCLNQVKNIINKNNLNIKSTNHGLGRKTILSNLFREKEDDYLMKVYNQKIFLPNNSSYSNLNPKLVLNTKETLSKRNNSTDESFKVIRLFSFSTKRIFLPKRKKNKKKYFQKSKFTKNVNNIGRNDTLSNSNIFNTISNLTNVKPNNYFVMNRDREGNSIFSRRIILEEKFIIDKKGNENIISIKEINSTKKKICINNKNIQRSKNIINNFNNKNNTCVNYNDINVNFNLNAVEKMNTIANNQKNQKKKIFKLKFLNSIKPNIIVCETEKRNKNLSNLINDSINTEMRKRLKIECMNSPIVNRKQRKKQLSNSKFIKKIESGINFTKNDEIGNLTSLLSSKKSKSIQKIKSLHTIECPENIPKFNILSNKNSNRYVSLIQIKKISKTKLMDKPKQNIRITKKEINNCHKIKLNQKVGSKRKKKNPNKRNIINNLYYIYLKSGISTRPEHFSKISGI